MWIVIQEIDGGYSDKLYGLFDTMSDAESWCGIYIDNYRIAELHHPYERIEDDFIPLFDDE
jgi:hypothetical protein